jgi:hypothetical protein
MSDEELPKHDSLSDFQYSAFEKWEYKPIIFDVGHPQSWINFADSFYQASLILVKGREGHVFYEDIEGVAAIFLFRHYLELALKRIIVRGRCLTRCDVNAAWEDVKQVSNIHNLQTLWNQVLGDAMPKINKQDWENYDIQFVEKCIEEFHRNDERGFAFRYPRQGAERYRYDFGWFCIAMERVQQILENITTYLIKSHAENAEWDAFLQEQVGF